MKKTALYFLICAGLFISKNIQAQYFPYKGIILNYNQVMFEYPAVPNAGWYKIKIIFNQNESTDFTVSKNIFGEFTDSSTACMISGLRFGRKYFWKVEAYDKNNVFIHSSPVTGFALMENEYGDSTLFKHKQYYNKKTKYRDGLIWCDTYHCAIDRDGQVVWQFPAINQNFENPPAMRDLRLHNNGTISFINDSNVYLINRDLTVLWNGPGVITPSGSKTQRFHHSFNVISANSYYTMGTAYKKLFDKPGLKDTMDNYLVNDFIVQYDSMGKILWRWEYDRDFFKPDYLQNTSETQKKQYLHPHINAISVDSQEKYVYISLRNLSCILKIEKLTNKTLACYGDCNGKSGPFNYQHDVKYIGNNRMTLFNNNSRETFFQENKKPECLSSVQVLALPAFKNDSLKVEWEFFTNFDTLSDNCSTRLGSVDYVNGNYLVCAGQNGRLFEVTPEKEVVWDMTIYKMVKKAKVFEKLPQYRIMYSSSLYPFFFTVKNVAPDKFMVYNEGTETDEFIVEYSGKGKKIKDIQKITLNPGEHTLLDIGAFSKKSKAIHISSVNSLICKKIK